MYYPEIKRDKIAGAIIRHLYYKPISLEPLVIADDILKDNPETDHEILFERINQILKARESIKMVHAYRYFESMDVNHTLTFVCRFLGFKKNNGSCSFIGELNGITWKLRETFEWK